MTRYETITNLGDDFMRLMAKSLVPVHILDWKVFYEAYLEDLRNQEKAFSKVRKTHSVLNVAERYKITDRTMRNVIAFMEGS